MSQTPEEKRAFDMGTRLMKLMTGRNICDEEACLKLITEGANTRIMDLNGYSLLYYAATAPAPHVFEKLLADETDIDRRMGSDKMSLLFFAAAGGNLAVLQQLIAKNADINTTNSRGHTPLMAATMNTHPETVRILLAAGANPAMTDLSGKTALDHAQSLQRPEIEPLLAEAMKNYNGMATGRAVAVNRPLRIKQPKP
jgi:ankyrin repeat protein